MILRVAGFTGSTGERIQLDQTVERDRDQVAEERQHEV